MVLGLFFRGLRLPDVTAGQGRVVHGEILKIDAVMAKIDAVTLEEVRSVAAEVFSRPEILAIVGPA